MLEYLIHLRSGCECQFHTLDEFAMLAEDMPAELAVIFKGASAVASIGNIFRRLAL